MQSYGVAYVAYLEDIGFAVVSYLADTMFSPDLINWSSSPNAGYFDFNNLVGTIFHYQNLFRSVSRKVFKLFELNSICLYIH